MANAFQEQLLKAGLVDSKKVKKVKQEQYKKQKQQGKQPTPAADDARVLAQKAQAESVERDRELNRQRKQEADRKAMVAQIRQLITMNAQPRDDGELVYNFSDQSLVKKLYVSPQTQAAIIGGRLCIVRLEQVYELVPRAVADKIAQRDASYVIVCNDSETNSVDADDPYAQYQVPDDLMW